MLTFIRALREARAAAETELAQRASGVPGSETTDELTNVVRELTELERSIAEGVIPGDRELMSAGYAKEWYPRTPLGERLALIGNAFRKLPVKP